MRRLYVLLFLLSSGVDDVRDYTVELALSDSSGIRIGLLVFGFPYSAAPKGSDAIKLLNDIRRKDGSSDPKPGESLRFFPGAL
jgi:hypothetical protein